MAIKSAEQARTETLEALSAVVSSQIEAAIQSGVTSCIVPLAVLEQAALVDELVNGGYQIASLADDAVILSW